MQGKLPTAPPEMYEGMVSSASAAGQSQGTMSGSLQHQVSSVIT